MPGKLQANIGLNNGIIRTLNAFGLIGIKLCLLNGMIFQLKKYLKLAKNQKGFIKFLEGYYMLLITKKLPVAVLGYHTIYTIDDVSMIYIPYTDKTNKEANLEEQKYFFVLELISNNFSPMAVLLFTN